MNGGHRRLSNLRQRARAWRARNARSGAGFAHAQSIQGGINRLHEGFRTDEVAACGRGRQVLRDQIVVYHSDGVRAVGFPAFFIDYDRIEVIRVLIPGDDGRVDR
ncbi:hypothetical protein [Salicola sp. Rm-C-2C1-2]|uniref:hypothetical protein n=1 Tax=Salicola sp. Rm-C-2C1-2 TaxID=3141321 RepID=UPI0032E40180